MTPTNPRRMPLLRSVVIQPNFSQKTIDCLTVLGMVAGASERVSLYYRLCSRYSSRAVFRKFQELARRGYAQSQHSAQLHRDKPEVLTTYLTLTPVGHTVLCQLLEWNNQMEQQYGSGDAAGYSGAD